MLYYVSKTNDTQFNIAFEEFCFKNLKNEDKIFLLWINKPSIIVGKYQNTAEEINIEYVKENNIEVVRRISGGGAVYHDLNNLNYTIISNETKGTAFDFKALSQPVIDTLAELGVEAVSTGRNDIEIDGQKICGNAQAYIQGRIMHHGCLLFDVDLSVLVNALKVSKDKIESKGVKSVRARVTNILPHLEEKISVEEFSNKILEHMKKEFPEMKEFIPTEEQLKEIKKIRDEKFATWDWNFGKNPEYNITRSTRFKAGKIQIFAIIEKNHIESIKIYGDFFGNNSNLEEFENHLIGTKYTREDITNRLKTINFAEYFGGFEIEELAEAICE